ncbi:hypothetical protein ES708_28337 [subsurface metagenome]
MDVRYRVEINPSYEWAEGAESLGISHRELEVFALVDRLRIRLNKKYEWLFNLANEQSENLGDYLHHRVDNVDFSSFADTHSIRADIEFFNMSIYTIHIGKVSISTNCNAHDAYTGQLSVDINKTLMWGKRGNYAIPITFASQKVIDEILEATEGNRKVHLQFTLDWSIEATYLHTAVPFQRQLLYEAIPKIPKS